MCVDVPQFIHSEKGGIVGKVPCTCPKCLWLQVCRCCLVAAGVVMEIHSLHLAQFVLAWFCGMWSCIIPDGLVPLMLHRFWYTCLVCSAFSLVLIALTVFYHHCLVHDALIVFVHQCIAGRCCNPVFE